MSSQNVIKIVFLAMVLTLAQACSSASSHSKTKEMVSEIRDDLQDLKEADADDWQSEQAEFQIALNKLEKNFDEVRSHYN